MDNVSFGKGYIEELPFPDDSFDVVISNGVVDLSAEKRRVFEEVRRVLRNDADLWVACIGGAEQVDDYTDLTETLGLDGTEVRENPEYTFVSEQVWARAGGTGVRSVSLAARKAAERTP